jgi:hypothetical protein
MATFATGGSDFAAYYTLQANIFVAQPTSSPTLNTQVGVSRRQHMQGTSTPSCRHKNLALVVKKAVPVFASNIAGVC